MSTTKFLYLYRSPIASAPKPPSPDEMQAIFTRWTAWKSKFPDEIVDVGDGLQPGGVLFKGGTVSDGPFIEAKEVLAGYSIVAASSLARAIEIAKECPIANMPGTSVEIRQMMGF